MKKLINVNGWYVGEIPVTRYDIAADTGGGLTFAFVTDLHEYPPAPVMRSLEGYAEKNGLDAVLVGGDYFHNYDCLENGLRFLELCSRAFPTICSTGNHEIEKVPGYRALAEGAGATVLENESLLFGGVNIGGLRGKHRPDRKWLEEFASLDGFKLLLSHHPEYYRRYISRLPVGLVLSGHAHGGQWRLFGRGLYAPGQGFFPRYTGGIYGGRLIVSRGIGNLSGLPRINNMPEIVVVRLENKGQGA